tara:strand:+ start:868 stop:1107 length:240 start_codon:yes stop_codon:yes gene_type:complete
MRHYIRNARQCFTDDKLKIISINDWGYNKVLIKSMVIGNWMADYRPINSFVISKDYLIRLVNDYKPWMIKELKDQFIIN